MVQVVQVVRIISQDDMHSENIWFSGSKPSNYQEKLRCHARDSERTDGGKWKKGQCSVRPETSIDEILSLYGESFVTVVDESQLLRKSQVEGPPYEPFVILFF